MKKLSLCILALLVVSLLALPVLAAQSATVTVFTSGSTVTRGDTFTVGVYTSRIENCSSGGFVFSYDKAVFDYVSGSAYLSGYTAGISTAAGNVAGYFMNGNAAVQGSIFQITLKVKDSAAFGSYSISGVASMMADGEAVACTVGSTSVTVACNHNYGGWSDAGNGTHSRTCSLCSGKETANHTWNSGSVTKPASCKETGVTTYICTVCNATKTETIAKTNDHKYGSWTKVSDTQHKHTCSVCSKEETANHTWNSGSVTKPASCKETGVKTYTCTVCNATKTEPIGKLTTHTYDHACDTDCNICGVTRTTTHNYKTSWSKDKTNHWHECSVCKDKKDAAAHTPGAEATETTAQTCTTCGYVMKAALGHKHSYAATWTTDEAGHWYACSGCEEKGSYAAHDFENACDPDCSICGYTRQTEHDFADNWTTDAKNHWHVCESCSLKQDETAHEPGAEATAAEAQTCTVCGYELAPALGEPETEPTQDTQEAAQIPTVGTESTGNETQSSFPWWSFLVAAIVIAGVGIVVIIRKK